MDIIEAETNPHEHEDPEAKIEESVSSRRRLKITAKDLKNYGYSPHCHRCDVHQLGQHSRAQYLRHSESCRTRIYEALRLAGSPRIANEDDKFRDNVKDRTPNEPNHANPSDKGPKKTLAKSDGAPESATPQDVPVDRDGDLEMVDDLDIGPKTVDMAQDDHFFEEINDDSMQTGDNYDDSHMSTMVDVWWICS